MRRPDEDLWKKGWLDEELERVVKETRGWSKDFHEAVRELAREARRAGQEEREIFGSRTRDEADGCDTPPR